MTGTPCHGKAATRSFEIPAQPGQFAISAQEHRGRVRLQIYGAVDIATRDALKTAAAETLRRPSTSTLVIDLGGVTFLDASGLGSLVNIRNASRQYGKSLVLSGVPARIALLLRLTDLSKHFAISGSLDPQSASGTRTDLAMAETSVAGPRN